jgi:hypothetical protein
MEKTEGMPMLKEAMEDKTPEAAEEEGLIKDKVVMVDPV